jgi:hypothetical protein
MVLEAGKYKIKEPVSVMSLLTTLLHEGKAKRG